MYRFFNKVSFLLLLVVFASHILAQAPSASPPNNAAEYKALVKEYKELTEKHADVLEETIANDPAFGRAKYWLENEQLEGNTPALQEDRVFFATLKDEESQTIYRNWQRGVSSRVTLDVWKSEWKKYPTSHKALLFFAAMSIKMSRRTQNSDENEGVPAENNNLEEYKELFHWADTILEKFSMNTQNVGEGGYLNFDSIPELGDEAQWSIYLRYAETTSAEFIEQVPFLERKLGIKPEMKQNFEKMTSDSALFNVYDTCYRLHYPVELKDIEKNQRKIRNQLMKINPNWLYDEGYAVREDDLTAKVPPANRPFLSWVFMGLGAMLILYAFFRMHQERKYKDD